MNGFCLFTEPIGLPRSPLPRRLNGSGRRLHFSIVRLAENGVLQDQEAKPVSRLVRVRRANSSAASLVW